MVVYKTINLINGKFYIGQDMYNDPKYLGSGVLIKKAILKYGIENFKKEILETCSSKDELNEREVDWIEKLNAIKEGYNIATGGQGGNTIEFHPNINKIKENVSKFHKNKKLTEDHKRKISESNKGTPRDNSHLHTPDIIKKRSETKKKNYKPYNLSDETKKKISDSLKGKKKPPRTKEHLEKLAESNKKIDKVAKLRGKTWEEIYGPEKAKQLRENRRLIALKRKNGTKGN